MGLTFRLEARRRDLIVGDSECLRQEVTFDLIEELSDSELTFTARDPRDCGSFILLFKFHPVKWGSFKNE